MYEDSRRVLGERRARPAHGSQNDPGIEPKHLVREAEPLGLSETWVIDRARHLVDRLPDAFSQAAAEAALSGGGAAFAGVLIDRARARADTLRAQLNRRL